MPKETIKIEGFSGLFGSFDPTDIPSGAAVFVDGLSFRQSPGKFEGLPDDGAHGSTAWNFGGGVPFQNSGELAAHHTADDKFYIISGVGHGSTPTRTAVGGAITGTNKGGVSDGFGVHMGLGRGNVPQHIADLGSGYERNPAVLDPPSTVTLAPVFAGTSVTGQATDPGPVYPFKKNTSYLYGVSYIYDGTQESPLFIDTADFVLVADDAWREKVDIPITRPGSKPNNRITHICLYRAGTGVSRDIKEGFESEDHPDTPGGPSAPIPFRRVTVTVDEKSLGNFTLVAIIEWADAAWSTNVYTVVDTFKIGQSFRNRTGFADTLEHMNLSYEIGVELDGFHIISGVEILEGSEDDAVMEFQLIRSKYRLYDTFDWSSDFYALPTKPVAMQVFQGRLFCFDIGRTYIVSSAFGSHETIEGVGAASWKSVVATERGMMVATEEQIWFHDRREFKDIGWPVMKLLDSSDTDVGYLQKAADDPVCLYSARHGLFIVAYKTSTTQVRVLLYDPELARWSHAALLSIGTTTLIGGFIAPSGRVFINQTDRLIPLFESTNTRASEFISKDFESDPYIQTFYYIAIRGDKPTLTWSEDGAAAFSVTLTTDAYGVHRGVINSSVRSGAGTEWKKTTKGRFIITMAANKEINDIAITRRVMQTAAIV